ncbi:MAG: 5-carboxymethyl-2-hydroxymuconate Delta-isomerase [Pseudomonadota bacterium]
MPHLIVEYSTNLEKRISIRDLLKRVHEAALASGVFKIGGIRTRAEPRDLYLVADGDPDNAFIHIEGRIGKGRDAETRRRLAETLLGVLCDQMKSVFETTGLGLTVEIREIDDTASVRLNNLHERLQTKETSRAG